MKIVDSFFMYARFNLIVFHNFAQFPSTNGKMINLLSADNTRCMNLVKIQTIKVKSKCKQVLSVWDFHTFMYACTIAQEVSLI